MSIWSLYIDFFFLFSSFYFEGCSQKSEPVPEVVTGNGK